MARELKEIFPKYMIRARLIFILAFENNSLYSHLRHMQQHHPEVFEIYEFKCSFKLRQRKLASFC